jgi:probable F420-dependent oxidoreductase
MKIGAVYPQKELSGDPAAVRQFGLAAEELGFDYLLAYDHVLGAVHEGRKPPLTGPYTEHDPFHDPLVMFAYLAGITTKLEFATGVLILPQRQTVLVARQAADVDLFSGGRLRLGVGIGWNYVEYEALGENFRTRGAREEEQLGLLRLLFSEDLVDFSGRFDRVDRAALMPKPTRPIPLWLGGSSEAAYDRAARLADGFVYIGSDSGRTTATWRQMQERLKNLDRPVEEFGAEFVTRPGAAGELAKQADTWQHAGGTHFAVVTMDQGLKTVDDHVAVLRSAAQELKLS